MSSDLSSLLSLSIFSSLISCDTWYIFKKIYLIDDLNFVIYRPFRLKLINNL